MDILMQIELGITHFLQNLGSWLQYPMQAFTFLGNELFFLLIMPAIYWSIDASLGFRTGMMLILSSGLNSGLKILFHGPRPFWVDRGVIAYSSETSFGIPSGHSQSAAAIWGMIAATLKKRWFTILAILVIFLIGLSRIYLGVHFVRDVLLGWLIGGLIILIYLKSEPAVTSWLASKTHFEHLLISFGFSLTLVLIGVIPLVINKDFGLPPEWISNALLAGADQPTPFSLDSSLTIAGVAFGFCSGYTWWIHKFGGSRISCSTGKRLIRYVIGLVGIVILYFGLKLILPEQPILLGAVLRYIRYALIGFWVTGFAPLLFRQLHLDR